MNLTKIINLFRSVNKITGEIVYDNEYYLLSDYKAIYILTPKVACTTVKKYIATILNLEGAEGNESIIHNKVNFPIVNKNEIFTKYKDYSKFAFVRNPWDRVVSCYLNKIKFDTNFTNFPYNNYTRGVANGLYKYGDMFYAGMEFSQFVMNIAKIPDGKSDPHFRSQHTFVYYKNKKQVDFLGKFENFEMDFYNIIHSLGLPKLEIFHMMKSDRKHIDYQDYYDNATKELVSQRYKEDIKLFKYDFK